MGDAAVQPYGIGRVKMSITAILRNGARTVGGWCTLPSSYSAEIMARAGFDWIGIDMQHGLIDRSVTVAMIQAADAAGTPALVRVPWNDESSIMFALDAGAAGVIVPMVSSADEAQRAAAAAKYPPLGKRSWGAARAAWAVAPYTPTNANRSTICLVQVETQGAIDSLEDILGVQGVDGVYVGPADLAIALGHPPTVSIKEMKHLDTIERIGRATLAAGLISAGHAADAETAVGLMHLGIHHVTIANDAALVTSGSAASMSTYRGLSNIGEQETG